MTLFLHGHWSSVTFKHSELFRPLFFFFFLWRINLHDKLNKQYFFVNVDVRVHSVFPQTLIQSEHTDSPQRQTSIWQVVCFSYKYAPSFTACSPMLWVCNISLWRHLKRERLQCMEMNENDSFRRIWLVHKWNARFYMFSCCKLVITYLKVG